MACAVFSVACLITANTVAVKLISVAGFAIPGGAVVYPLSFLLSDVLTEVYGYAASRRVIWLGLGANLIFVVVAEIVLVLPSASFWTDQAAYVSILGYAPRILAGAAVSYFAGDFANSFVMSRMKVFTKGRYLWSRSITSTIIGQGIDSLVFVSIAFAGTIPLGQIRNVILTLWIFKVGYETIGTPLTYLAVNFLKRVENLDTFDIGVSYTPFSLA